MAKITLVDDDENIVTSVSLALESHGHVVKAYYDGASGLAALESDPPDLVILDIMMPGLSGVEVCRLIRAESKTPIILLTARDAELDKVLGLEVGADDYVTKPFSLRELSARVRAVLRRIDPASASSEKNIIDFGAVQIDLAGHRVTRAGEVLPLKPRAFQLLAFLLEHQGQVFTREQLLARVWGTDYPGETRTVDVHMHALRELIEVDSANPTLLQTVRGVGYIARNDA